MTAPGTVLNGRYRLDHHLSSGGMGQVWRALDLRLDRPVAVKMVLPSAAAGIPDPVALLRDEAKAGARLIGHPSVVSTLDLRTWKDPSGASLLYIVLELIEGDSLHDWILRYYPQIDVTTYYSLALYIALRLCRALEFAHRLDVIHRDIKPANVLLTSAGVPKITDFGIARFVNAKTRAYTVSNFLSYPYAAPEQWDSSATSAKSDLYQLGCTLYELFTGGPPFSAAGIAGYAHAHKTQAPQPLSTVNPRVPLTLSKAVLGLLEKDPKKRKPLWTVVDPLSAQLQGVFSLSFDVSSESTAVRKRVSTITTFNAKDLAAGPVTLRYPDAEECFCETLQLLALGIMQLRITRQNLVKDAKTGKFTLSP